MLALQTFPRTAHSLSATRLAIRPCRQPILTALFASQTRFYASKRKGEKEKGTKTKHSPLVAAQDLVPGSQQIMAGEEYFRAEEKMKSIVDKYRKDVADNKGADGKGVKLEDIATVGVREGTTLLITVFEEHTLKHVEQALYDAKLPGVVPQKMDSRTIRVPMPKPTVESRMAMYATAQKQAEDTRVNIRKQHQTSLKKGKYAKYSPEADEFQTLSDKYLGEVDKIIAEVKKTTGTK